MKVIIAGPRDYEDFVSVLVAVQLAPFIISEVVSGAARGVDTLGERWATEHKIPIKRFHADWGTFGKGAGPKRNLEMSKYSDGAIILWDGMTKGTGSMLKIAKAHGLQWFVYGIRGYRPRKKVSESCCHCAMNDREGKYMMQRLGWGMNPVRKEQR